MLIQEEMIARVRQLCHEDDKIVGRVPEPTTVSMIALGGLFVLARRKRNRFA